MLNLADYSWKWRIRLAESDSYPWSSPSWLSMLPDHLCNDELMCLLGRWLPVQSSMICLMDDNCCVVDVDQIMSHLTDDDSSSSMSMICLCNHGWSARQKVIIWLDCALRCRVVLTCVRKNWWILCCGGDDMSSPHPLIDVAVDVSVLLLFTESTI
jgi:hypothetical protein